VPSLSVITTVSRSKLAAACQRRIDERGQVLPCWTVSRWAGRGGGDGPPEAEIPGAAAGICWRRQADEFHCRRGTGLEKRQQASNRADECCGFPASYDHTISWHVRPSVRRWDRGDVIWEFCDLGVTIKSFFWRKESTQRV